ncbi:MAG: hypothetical protein LBN28_05125 [Desulfovibrio sp.]|jgi:ABC-type uncharacterized transport system auxiliary subunit|nr:hypothetical protein [Desulfovibrio sp.]
MGSCVPFYDEASFAERVKALANEELLEIWEETQRIERLLSSDLRFEVNFAPDYEKAIVDELRLRAFREQNADHRSPKPDKRHAANPGKQTGV